MVVTVNLDYTPISPQQGMEFTESSFVRQRRQFSFALTQIAVALVDLWNYGWENSPVVDTLGFELSLERGLSHAIRKRQIIERNIAPTVNELRKLGVRIFHCNHPHFLMRYPQWELSTTEIERQTLNNSTPNGTSMNLGPEGRQSTYPPVTWTEQWKSTHENDIHNYDWVRENDKAYYQIEIPTPVEPKDGDMLVFSQEQFHRLLTENQIRVLFYMGFETDICVQWSTYGINNMHTYGYMTNIVRDCTTTVESAETLSGLWRTRVAIEYIERKFGYSTTSATLLDAVRRGDSPMSLSV